MNHITVVTGSADDIAEILCGPRQMDEHCRGYRWHQYMADQRKRYAAMREEGLRMIAKARAKQEAAETYLMAAE